MANPKDLYLYHGSITIQRDGHVGLTMDSEGNKVVVDGESVHVDDVRFVPNGANDAAIMALAEELGFDEAAQYAIVEGVNLLREKQAQKLPANVVPMTRKFEPFLPPTTNKEDPFGSGEAGTVEPPSPEEEAAQSDVRTMNLNGKRVRLNDGTEAVVENVDAEDAEFLYVLKKGAAKPSVVFRRDIISVISGEDAPVDFAGVPSSVMSTINSLRAENTLLHREIDQLKAAAKDGDELAGLRRELAIEQAGRKKAEAAIEEAMKLKLAAENAAVLADFERRKALNGNADSVVAPGAIVSSVKPVEAKIVKDTSEDEFARLWASGWELIHTQIMDNDVRYLVQTVWRKDNSPASPIEPVQVEKVALPTIPSMEAFDAGEAVEFMTLKEVDEILYGDPVPSVNEIAESDVIEIAPADLFPRFDKLEAIVKDLPIASALLHHGLDKVNAAFDEMEQRVINETAVKIHAIGKRPVHQFSLPEKV